MSKYYRAEDVEAVLAEKHMNRPLDSDRWVIGDIGKSIADLPTIEVSEEVLPIDHCIMCYEFLKERIGSEITDNAEEFEKWFKRMAWHVQKCNEYDEDAISRADLIQDLRKNAERVEMEEFANDTVWRTIGNAPSVIPQVPSEDAISREWLKKWMFTEWDGSQLTAFKMTDFAPSVLPKRSCYRCGLREDCEESTEPKPKEGEWIPCSEKLPQACQEVQLTCEVRPVGRKPFRYVCTAEWIPRFCQEALSVNWDDETTEYCEEDDEYYPLEGWYECIRNWDDYSLVGVADFAIAWKPVEEPYKGAVE